VPESSRRRWAVLGAYAALAATTQLLWLTFAAIDTDVAPVFHVDVGTVGDLSAIFPAVYILLALPTGRWLDLRFNQALGFGAALAALGAVLRVVNPDSFAWQLGGQVVIAAAQPLVLNAVNKVAARYFPESERAVAIAVGSAGLFAGILVAVLTAGPLFAAGGLRLLLMTQAVAAVAVAVAVLLALRVPTRFGDVAVSGSLGWLRGDRFMWRLAVLVFVGMGTYNAVATFLQPVLRQFGEGAAAGPLLAVMTLAGIAGAATLAPAVAARDARRLMLTAALVISAVAFGLLAAAHTIPLAGVWLAIDGFVLLACLPVVLDWAEIHTGGARQGTAVGFLMLAGNLGGVVYILAAQAVIGSAYLVLGLLALTDLAALAVALQLPRTGTRGATGPETAGLLDLGRTEGEG
jgi:predicted MFS family arabinose efflux permease